VLFFKIKGSYPFYVCIVLFFKIKGSNPFYVCIVLFFKIKGSNPFYVCIVLFFKIKGSYPFYVCIVLFFKIKGSYPFYASVAKLQLNDREFQIQLNLSQQLHSKQNRIGSSLTTQREELEILKTQLQGRGTVNAQYIALLQRLNNLEVRYHACSHRFLSFRLCIFILYI
jgi:hypothetical protein